MVTVSLTQPEIEHQAPEIYKETLDAKSTWDSALYPKPETLNQKPNRPEALNLKHWTMHANTHSVLKRTKP